MDYFEKCINQLEEILLKIEAINVSLRETKLAEKNQREDV
jgi:hypothetical protein